MHLLTPLIALLTLATTALATARPARQYYRLPSPERSNQLLPRIDIDPTLVCGENYVDCNNGWCCSQGATCQTLNSIPVCKDPTQSFYGGTVPAVPFKSVNQVASSLEGVLSSLTAGQITWTGGASTNTAAPTGTTAKTIGSSATSTAAVAKATNTGGAGRLGAWGAVGVVGAGVMMVV